MLIKDITVLNSNMEPLEHRNVVVKDGRFDSIGVDVVEKDPEMVIDGKNKLLMPGFYNTHCHVPMTLTRGRLIALDSRPQKRKSTTCGKPQE